MEDTATGGDEYARQPVPTEKTVAGFQIALVIVGGTIAVPGFILAAQIAEARALGGAVPAFLIGSLILAVLAVLTGIVGTRTRVSTYVLARSSFGIIGARLVALVVSTALFGWFAVLAGVFGTALKEITLELFALDLPESIFIVIGALLFMCVTALGFRAIDKFAAIVVPAMLALLVYTAYTALADQPLSKLLSATEEDMSLGVAISAVVGTYIVGAVTNPDYTRYARTITHSVIASVLGLGISFPFVLTLAAIPSVTTGETDLIRIMIGIGIGVPALFLLVLSTWSSNALVLYSSSLSTASITHRLRYWQIVVLIAILGTILAILGVMNFFIPFLVVLGTAIPPIGAIYVLHHFWIGDEPNPAAIEWAGLIAWVAGFLAGLTTASIEAIVVTGTPSLDALIAALLCYALLATRKGRQSGVAGKDSPPE